MASVRELVRWPVIQAPLGGGPSRPELAAAVSNAGGLGFLAAGYKTADEVALEIAATKRLTEAPFGVNVFVPYQPRVDEVALGGYLAELQAEASRFGSSLGPPVWSDDDWTAKLAVLVRDPVPVVSFAFGCPSRDILSALQKAGSRVVVTITTPKEIVTATAMGVDALCCQGIEAGAHRGGFTDDEHDDGFGVARAAHCGAIRDGSSAHRGRRIGGRTRRRGSARGRCRSCAARHGVLTKPREWCSMTRTRQHWPIHSSRERRSRVRSAVAVREASRTASCWNIRMLRPHIRRSIRRLAPFEMTLPNEAIPIA